MTMLHLTRDQLGRALYECYVAHEQEAQRRLGYKVTTAPDWDSGLFERKDALTRMAAVGREQWRAAAEDFAVWLINQMPGFKDIVR